MLPPVPDHGQSQLSQVPFVLVLEFSFVISCNRSLSVSQSTSEKVKQGWETDEGHVWRRKWRR